MFTFFEHTVPYPLTKTKKSDHQLKLTAGIKV